MTSLTIPHRRQQATRLIGPLLLALSVLPVIYMLTRALLSTRNAAYWDEIDDVLGLMLRLDGGTWQDTLARFFAIENEHRTLTSRLLFAGSYWFTGTVNFTIIGVIGNLFLCGLCGLLVATAGAMERKVQMGVLLAALIFQLEHYENFLWSGASIDHFQVLLFAGGALMALARGTRAGLLGAGLLGLLATFTLAHGLVIWPIGALVLAVERRWIDLRVWLGLTVAVVGVFFAGFEFNPAHHVGGDITVAGIVRTFGYWLTLLGAPLALGEQPLAPFLGAVLLVLLARRINRAGFARERIALPLALWAVGSLVLVAIGRVDFSHGAVASRYYVLGALAWALVLFMQFEDRRDAARPYRFLLRALPLLALFNILADASFESDAQDWLSRRDIAVDSYMHTGKDGVGRYALHPDTEHATRLLQQVEQAGVYQMPQVSAERWFPEAQPVTNLTYNVDRVKADSRMVSIQGWAALAGHVAKPGQVHVILESDKSKHIFAARTVVRADVANAYPAQRWRSAGFEFEARRWSLPKENFKIGVLIHSDYGAEYIMTAQRLDLTETGAEIDPGVVHPNGNVYDRMVLRSASATVTAEAHRITRVSLIDLTDTIVNLEFSGAGSMTVTLDNPSGPAAPQSYNQPKMLYMKGHPSIAISGADETTNLSIVSVRSSKPANQLRAADSMSYDGLAHVASVSIVSRNGKFGALRSANANYTATKGLAGVYAPGVHFTGPVYVGDINACATATPTLQLGSATDVRITGGDLQQTNGAPVNISGITHLKFVEGRTAAGAKLPQKASRGVLHENGSDVTARIAAYPAQK